MRSAARFQVAGHTSRRPAHEQLQLGRSITTSHLSGNLRGSADNGEVMTIARLILIVALFVPSQAAYAQADAAQPAAAMPDPAAAPAQQSAPRPLAVEYSDAYALRRKIHVYASVATIPLFAAQYFIGDKLYQGDGSENLRSTHAVVGAGIGALFAVNTVTGAWNLWEARKDPKGRTRRLVHGLSMLGADVGFVATGMMAPDDDEGERGGDGGRRSLHRNVAVTSMGIATASYLYMLLTR